MAVRVRILSDIHIDFGDFIPPKIEADIVVLAGDIGTQYRGLEWALSYFPEIPIVYVLGNHEYYGAAIPELIEQFKSETAGTNVHLLENDVIEINGVLFLGCTLWTDFSLFGAGLREVAMATCQIRLNDYRKIRVSPGYSLLTPNDTLVFHNQSRQWLTGKLRNTDSRPVVVVTHHAPSARSINAVFSDDLINTAFASGLENLIETSPIALWVHGHTHYGVDYTLGKTRIISNPRGYPRETSHPFDPAFVLEIDSDF